MEEIALAFAKKHHEGQTRRDGTPYINHPIAVANMLQTEEEKAVALLHDVLEDTEATIDDLLNLGLPITVCIAVTLLTKKEDMDYDSYIKAITTSTLATKVKLADIFHNLSDNPTEKQKAKYLKAIPMLLNTF